MKLRDELVQDDVDEVGEDGKQVDEVHRLHEEPGLGRRGGKPNDVLDGEVHGREVVHVQDDLRRRLAFLDLLLGGDVQLGVRTGGREGGGRRRRGSVTRLTKRTLKEQLFEKSTQR